MSEEKVGTVLAHELVHMYDNCANNVDWTDSHHLACSEVTASNHQPQPSVSSFSYQVRAASIAHCEGPLHSALYDGGAWTSLFSQHSQCVKTKAIRSVQVDMNSHHSPCTSYISIVS